MNIYDAVTLCSFLKSSICNSSVTAGHDSPFERSYPVVVGQMMEDAFKPVNVKFVSRNVALGNNPCVPYDICVNTFAGLDADIVHWEQSYFCFHGHHAYEQFIRQALMSPNRPIVVFDDSETGHWLVLSLTLLYEFSLIMFCWQEI